MKNNLIFIPVLFQIVLTFGLYIYLAIAKSRAVKLGRVNNARRDLHDDAWPDNVLQINNCIRNQFELPVLFYVLTVILWCTDSVNVYILALASFFVISRIFHAIIHAGSNYVPLRRRVFMIGGVTLMVIAVFSIYTVMLV